MIRINIYDTNSIETNSIQNIIKEYSEIKGIVIQERIYYSLEDMIKFTDICDICIISLKIYNQYKEKLKFWKENTNTNFIYLSDNAIDIVKNMNEHWSDYFLLRPLVKENIFNILDDARKYIKETSIIAKIPHSGDERIKINELNYINIVNRSLRYHLYNGKYVDSQTLRQSFSKEINPLLEHKELHFIQPSLLINLTNIKKLYNDHIEFNDGEILFYPKTAYANLLKSWKNYII